MTRAGTGGALGLAGAVALLVLVFSAPPQGGSGGSASANGTTPKPPQTTTTTTTVTDPGPQVPPKEPEEPPALTFSGDEAARTVRFDRTDDRGRVAELVVVLKTTKDQAGPVAVDLLPLTGPANRVALTEQPSDAYPRQAPALWAARKDALTLKASDVNVVALRLGLAWGARVGAGLALVRFRLNDHPKMEPAVLRIAAELPELKPEPKEPKLGVTRWLGPLSGLVCTTRCDTGDEVALHLRGDGAYAYQQATPKPRVGQLRSDTYGEARAELSAAGGAKSDAAQAGVTLEAKDITRTGKYAGAIPLGGPAGGEDQLLAVELNVQDMILWPLIVLAAGALLGGYGVHLYQRRRRRDVLKAELTRVLERLDGVEPPPDMFELGVPVFGPADTERRPTRCTGTAARPRFQDAWCAASTATGDADFEAAAKMTADVVDEIERWLALRDVYAALRKAREDFVEEAAPEARQDARELELQLEQPVTAAEAAAWLELAAGQIRVMAALEEVWALWSAPSNQQGGGDNPAQSIYAPTPFPRTPEQTAALLQQLRAKFAELERPEPADLEAWAQGVSGFTGMPASRATRLLARRGGWARAQPAAGDARRGRSPRR